MSRRGRRALLGIQGHLEAIYALRVEERAADFVIDDAGLEELVRGGIVPPEHLGAPEQVLVLPDGDSVALAVHLSDPVLMALDGAPSLQDHCHATEGVSHFVTLLWSVRRGRALRLFDLELQAEVDKAATTLLLAADRGREARRSLVDRLFGAIDLLPGLDAEAAARYVEAHRLGRRYAGRLDALLDVGVDALLAELRDFVRLPADDKRARAAAA